MSNRRESTLKSQFQAKRTRLLYYIYSQKNRQIEDDLGIKSRLTRAFKYKTNSHLHHDLDYLIEHGLLEKENGYYKVTKKGRGEFTLISTLRLAFIMSVFLGLYVTFVGLTEIFSSIRFGSEFYLLLGFVLVTFGLMYWLSFREFSPNPPENKQELN